MVDDSCHAHGEPEKRRATVVTVVSDDVDIPPAIKMTTAKKWEL